MEQISNLITRKLETIVETNDPHAILPKCKAISALLPYVTCLGQGQGMVDVISRAATTSNSMEFVWGKIGPNITTLFDKPRPPSHNFIMTLMSLYGSWGGEDTVTRWVAVASAAQHTQEVGRSVVGALLRIASSDSLRPHVPIELWAWMKTQQSLPPRCPERFIGAGPEVVRFFRGLGDIEILTSYILLVWSEWGFIPSLGLDEMETLIREDLGDIRMRHHRERLIRRLDHVLRQLDRGLEYLRQHNPLVDENGLRLAKSGYKRLKRVLLEVGRRDVGNPPCAPHNLIHSNKILTPMACTEYSSLFAGPRLPTPMVSKLG